MSIIWKDAEVWTALPGLSREDQGGGRSLGSEEGGLLITLRGACHVASTAGWPCADSSGEGPTVPWLFPGDRRPGTVRGRFLTAETFFLFLALTLFLRDTFCL